MYQDFYELDHLPFELTANTRFLIMTAGHREALSVLQYGVQSRKAITLLVAEAGTGKTTLLGTLRSRLESIGATFILIDNPRLTREEFVETVATGFHLSPAAVTSKATMLREIEPVLKARVREGRPTALIVDEAQALPDELLEEVRLLANMEADSIKLLPVVLAGQSELADRLNRPSLRQLKQRVALRCDLKPLTATETASYVIRRVAAAGGDCATVFTREAVETIHQLSGGIPRLINILADNALMTGMVAGARPVKRDIVRRVASELEMLGQPVVPVAEFAQSVTPIPSPTVTPVRETSVAFEPYPARATVPPPTPSPKQPNRILGLS